MSKRENPVGINAAVSWLTLASLCILLLFQGLFPTAVKADSGRSYYFPEVMIEAEVHPDGSMTVVEERTFDFNGRFFGVTQLIKLQPGVDFHDVSVGEAGIPYMQVPAGTTEGAGIFFVDRDSEYFYIDWSFEAYNERRTFIISYRVENAVAVHLDTAELYWQFIGDETDARISRVRVTLALPPGAPEEEIRAWAHGPLYGELAIEGPDRVVWVIDDLPRNTFLEGRVTFPVEMVPGSTNFSGEARMEAILAEEEREARQANLRRFLLRLDFILGPLALMAALVFYFVLRRKSTRHPAAYSGDYYRDLPGEYPPAEAGYLFRRGSTKPEDFTATVMDLARRGHLRLEEYKGEEGRIRKRSFTDYRAFPAEGKDTLSGHERNVHNFLFNQVAAVSASEGTAFRDIEQFGKSKPSSMQSFHQRWRESISKSVKKQGFFGGVAVSGIVTGIVLLLVGILCVPLQLPVSAFFTIFAGLFLAGGSALLKNMTPAGADHYAKWIAFRRFLLHFSEMERSTIPSLQVWEYYLVYAVALGVAKEVIRQLQLVFPELKEAPVAAGRTLTAMGLVQSGGFNNANSALQQSFRAAFRSSSSSGSGRGGGFSGGGGGGGGGGGFRVR